MYIPYRLDVASTITPVSNYLIILITVAIFALSGRGMGYPPLFYLDGVNASLFTYVLMHDNWLHLLANMYCLFAFGNLLCSRIGNATYPAVYMALAAGAGLAQVGIGELPTVGATGAVFGVLGLFLYFYPKTRVKCFWIGRGDVGTEIMPAYALVLFVVSIDLLLVFESEIPMAIEGHIGGLFTGILIAWGLDKLNWVKRESQQAQLNELIKGKER